MYLPSRTVERLSKYRRLLTNNEDSFSEYIFSHELAKLLNLTPAQVRRDLMLIGLTGNHRKGYKIDELIQLISNTIDCEHSRNIAVVGIGNLGRAIIAFLQKHHSKLVVIAAFDNDPKKINRNISGIPCYGINDSGKIIGKKNISIVVLSVPAEAAQKTAENLVRSGIKGILNLTSVHLDLPKEVYLKDYDIITSLEEIGFFIK